MFIKTTCEIASHSDDWLYSQFIRDRAPMVRGPYCIGVVY